MDQSQSCPDDPTATDTAAVTAQPEDSLASDSTTAAAAGAETSSSDCPQKARLSDSVARCVYALKEASDVNQKFAALIMVTKVIKSDNLDERAKNKLFDAIGIDFLMTMIREDALPEGCPNSIFKSIALSILTCFVTSSHKKSSIHELVPDLLGIISNPEFQEDNLTLIQDAFLCLEGIATHRSGRKAIMSNDGLGQLVDIYVQENFCQEFAMKILVVIMMSEGSNTWVNSFVAFTKLMNHMCQEFSSNQSDRKFELCSPLVELLHCVPDSVPGDDGYEWQKQLHRGLCDILLSKLGRHQRYQGLNLAAAALDALGATWVVAGSPKGHQLMLIMVHLACVEVRMSLENETFEKTVDLAPQTTSCYSLLENAIKFLVNGALEMEEKQKQQLYAALKGAFNAVLLFLKEVTEEKFHTSNETTQMFICATIRVLGAWLAEETAANKEEVYGILPFVVGMARYNFQWNNKAHKSKSKRMKADERHTELPDLLRFLLPGLCHLTAEDEPRYILLQLNIEDLLFEYFVYKYDAFKSLLESKKKKDDDVGVTTTAVAVESVCDTLVTLCSIFMNIVVTSQKEVQTKNLYLQLLKYIFCKIGEIPAESSYLPLCGNLCVLGLMILKHQFMNIKNSESNTIFRFIQSTVRFLWDAHNVEESIDYATLVVSQSYHMQWNNLMELWFLGMHNLMTLLSHVPWLTDFLLECDWPQTIVLTLSQVRPGGVEVALKTTLEDMLCMIVRCSEPAKRALRQTDAVRVAKLHDMDSLTAQLQG